MWLRKIRRFCWSDVMFTQMPFCVNCSTYSIQKCCYSQGLETKYTEAQREKILKIVNDADVDILSRFEITKGRLKKIAQWKSNNGKVSSLSDIELIDGFNIKTATKLFDSIVEDRAETKDPGPDGNKIKGQILHPNMTEDVRTICSTVLAVYITVNSVCWVLINKNNYEVAQWQYFSIDYPEGKKLKLTGIFDIAKRVTDKLPLADVYAMKDEATTLRAAGSDPTNPKVISVNLQKAQLVAMIVALVNARSWGIGDEDENSKDKIRQKIYFLRPKLPFRLYGTLVGSERVSTDQTVEMLLQDCTKPTKDGSKVYIPEELQTWFRLQKDLQKDMLGHCLLLGLTFMDLCIYKNIARRKPKLLESGE